jgi:hypothetical protein
MMVGVFDDWGSFDPPSAQQYAQEGLERGDKCPNQTKKANFWVGLPFTAYSKQD